MAHVVSSTVPHGIQRTDYTELRICASNGPAYGGVGKVPIELIELNPCTLCNTCR